MPSDEAPLHGVEARVEQQLAHAQHAVHRRAQLVIHARDEVALRAAENLQLLVALFQFVRADAHRLFQLAAVAQLTLAPQLLQPPEIAEDQQDDRRIQQARSQRVPGRRRDVHGNRQVLLAPDAIRVRSRALGTRTRPRPGSCRSPDAAAPASTQSGSKPSSRYVIAIVGGRHEVQRRELERHELVAVRERERPIGAGQLRQRQLLIEDRDRGQREARRRRIRRRRVRQRRR